MKNYIYKSLATCPTSSKIVGENVTMTLNITSGKEPYTITYKKNGIILTNGVQTAQINGIYSYVYTTLPGDIGTQIFSAEVIDSCTQPQSFTDQCTVTITAQPCQQVSCSLNII